MFDVNNPKNRSWISVAETSDFPIQNIPFGIFQIGDLSPRACSAIDEFVVDLAVLAEHGFFADILPDNAVLRQNTLNSFIALGKKTTNAVRARIAELLAEQNHELKDQKNIHPSLFYPIAEVTMLLPIHIPNYTDFYSSKEHATNVGKMFRDPANALLPNWLHLPVGYHGRASSIVVSGTDILRPFGQTKTDSDPTPVFGPTRLLDFELEMGFVIGKATKLGERISTANAEEHIFGLMLFNDWSARDIQKWEYVPLGPFLAKNFASTISPWIVTLEALEPFRVPTPTQSPEVLPYLQFSGEKNYDIQLSVDIIAENSAAATVAVSNFKYMYWNMCQQLAHHTVNGCNIAIGDMYASGTISGPEKGSFGSMLEITWQGKEAIVLSDGSERKFIQDGDTVAMRGWCEKDGVRIGFGPCDGKILKNEY